MCIRDSFKITELELASVDEYPFNEYQNRYNGIVMYFRKNKLICHDSGNIIIIDGTSAVSYTHLDVYKRQNCRWWHYVCGGYDAAYESWCR